MTRFRKAVQGDGGDARASITRRRAALEVPTQVCKPRTMLGSWWNRW